MTVKLDNLEFRSPIVNVDWSKRFTDKDTGTGLTVAPVWQRRLQSLWSVVGSISQGAEEIISPLDFGAAGDGVTDDTVAVNAAVTAVPAGGTLTLGDNLFAITSQIHITKRMSITATGAGGFVEKVAIAGPNGAGAMVFFDGAACSGSVVQGVNFYGIETQASFIADPGALGSEYCGLRFGQCDRVQANFCGATGKRYGIVCDRSTNTLISAFRATGILTVANVANDNYNAAILMRGVNNATVDGWFATKFGQGFLSGFAIDDTEAFRMFLTGGHIDTCYNNGIYISGGRYSVIAGCIVDNVQDNFGNGIKMRGDGNRCIGNEITNCQVGIGVAGDGTVPDGYNKIGHGIAIIGNYIENINFDGINIGDNAGFNCRDVQIQGNYLRTTATSNNAFGGIRGSGDYHQIQGNILEDIRSQYAILIGPSDSDVQTQGHTIAGNQLINCPGVGIQVNATINSVISRNTFRDLTGVVVTGFAISLLNGSTGNLIEHNFGIAGLTSVVVSTDATSINNSVVNNHGGSGGIDLSIDETKNNIWVGPRSVTVLPGASGINRGQIVLLTKAGSDDWPQVGVVKNGADVFLPITQVYIESETGANNAIATAAGSGPALQDGLVVTIKLAHTLQAGVNTLNYNGTGAVSIKKATNFASDLATPFVVGSMVTLVYSASQPVWMCVSQ